MKHVIKLRLFRGNSTSSQILHLSSLAKSKPSKKSPNYEDQTETPVINSLFKEITDILGPIDTIPNKHPSEISLSRESQSRVNEPSSRGTTQLLSHCRQPVCENASDSATMQKMESFSNLEHSQKSFVSENDDLSSIVNEIAGIVISGDGVERRLESVKLHLKPEIVEKVLKRCFKVPHLAFRFFSWIKGRNGFCHTVETYNTMLCIAGEAREFGVVENLVEEMERNSCQMDIKTWTILIMIYGKAKLIGKALLCFEKMRKLGHELDIEAYRILIRSLCNADKGEIAFEIYKEMVKKEMVLDWSLYKMLVNCLAKSRNATAIGLVADDMIRISQIPERDVYVYLLKSYCVVGRIRKALEYIRELKNKEIPIDSEHYEILVKGLCRAGRVSDALEIVEIMKKSDFVDAKIYGIIINGYLRSKELSKALEQFQAMKELGHCPSASTYTELMQHLFDRNEYQTGCQLYNEMIERGIEIDSVAMMAIAAGHVRQDNIAGAWKVFNTMKDDGLKPTRKSYMIFLKELYKISRTDEMLKVLTEMKASRIYIHDETFRWVTSLMEKKGDLDGMQKVKQLQGSYTSCPIEEQVPEISELHKTELSVELNYGKVKHNREDALFVKPIVKAYSNQDLQEISGILSSSTDWASVKEALEKTNVQFTPELVTEVLHTSRMYGNVALNFFSWVGTQMGYRHTSETYNMAMKISGRGKDFKHMRDLFYQMRRSGCLATTDTWAIMIMQYGRMGMTKIALNIFSEMKTSGFNPKGSTYKFLIICLCNKKGRKVNEAIKTFQEMIHARYIPDKELVETYIGCLCEVDKLPEARWCIDSLCKLGFSHSYTYSTYVRALCRAGKMEEALSVVNEFRDKDSSILDQSTYGSIVHGLLRKGQLEEATAKMEFLKQAGIKPTVHVYTSLMVYYFREQQIEKAVEILEKMKKEGVEPTIVTYSSLIRGYMNMGRDGDAWGVFHSLKLRGVCPDFKTYSMFISCLCKAGKSEDGLKLLYEMLESGICPSTINFRTVMFGLNREGKFDLAQAVLKQKSELKSKRKFLSL